MSVERERYRRLLEGTGAAGGSGPRVGGSRAPVVGRKFRRLCVVLFPGEFWASLSGDAARLICTSLFVTRLLFDCRG